MYLPRDLSGIHKGYFAMRALSRTMIVGINIPLKKTSVQDFHFFQHIYMFLHIISILNVVVIVVYCVEPCPSSLFSFINVSFRIQFGTSGLTAIKPKELWRPLQATGRTVSRGAWRRDEDIGE